MSVECARRFGTCVSVPGVGVMDAASRTFPGPACSCLCCGDQQGSRSWKLKTCCTCLLRQRSYRQPNTQSVLSVTPWPAHLLWNALVNRMDVGLTFVSYPWLLPIEYRACFGLLASGWIVHVSCLIQWRMEIWKPRAVRTLGHLPRFPVAPSVLSRRCSCRWRVSSGYSRHSWPTQNGALRIFNHFA
jgi:hypothetical protein